MLNPYKKEKQQNLHLHCRRQPFLHTTPAGSSSTVARWDRSVTLQRTIYGDREKDSVPSAVSFQLNVNVRWMTIKALGQCFATYAFFATLDPLVVATASFLRLSVVVDDGVAALLLLLLVLCPCFFPGGSKGKK